MPYLQEFKAFNKKNIHQLPQFNHLSKEQQFEILVVAQIYPFRVNRYVIEELIDWQNIPNDPIFQLTFPQRGMLEERTFAQIASLLKKKVFDKQAIERVVKETHLSLNPQPAEQIPHNIPLLKGKPLPGMQHKYKETVLFFPSQGQTCHTYCTFCFRWAQFVGDKILKFESTNVQNLVDYLEENQSISDLLITGGDPFVANTRHLAQYLEPLISNSSLEHVTNIRIGTKALTYWPQRFTEGEEADALIRLLEKLVQCGKHISIMAHYNHWIELESPRSTSAIKRLQQTGAIIRSQGPVLRHVNDCPQIWSKMWKKQVQLGIIPYYLFVERDTGSHHYFKLPLHEIYSIYVNALKNVSGLARTVRGPTMSCGPGKVIIDGISEIGGEKIFVLRFLQSRNPDWTHQPFFAKYDEATTWFDELTPAFNQPDFFFEKEYQSFLNTKKPSVAS